MPSLGEQRVLFVLRGYSMSLDTIRSHMPKDGRPTRSKLHTHLRRLLEQGMIGERRVLNRDDPTTVYYLIDRGEDFYAFVKRLHGRAPLPSTSST